MVNALVMLRERTYSGLTPFVRFNKQERGFSYRAFPLWKEAVINPHKHMKR